MEHMLALENELENRYLLVCVAGLILSYWQFVPWRLTVLISNRISASLGEDVSLGLALLLYRMIDKASIAEPA